MKFFANAFILVLLYVKLCNGAPGGCDLIMFVTRLKYHPGVGYDFVGKIGADQICNSLGQNMQIEIPTSGRFRAFLSTATSDIRSELGIFPANVCLPNLQRVVSGNTSLLFDFGASLENTITRDENGAIVASTEKVWTGSTESGLRHDKTCDSWTRGSSVFDQANVGSMIHSSSLWLNDRVLGCSAARHLYCYEVLQRNCRTIFVTTATMKGDFGSIDLADQICHDQSIHANTVDYVKAPVVAGTRRYRAIVSNGSSDAIDRLGLAMGTQCIERVDRAVISLDGLVDRSPSNPLFMPVALTNEGVSVNQDVWTGTLENLRGDLSSQCNGWKGSNLPFFGTVGNSQQTTRRWIDDTSDPCFSQNALYCISEEITPETTVAPSTTSAAPTTTTEAKTGVSSSTTQQGVTTIPLTSTIAATSVAPSTTTERGIYMSSTVTDSVTSAADVTSAAGVTSPSIGSSTSTVTDTSSSIATLVVTWPSTGATSNAPSGSSATESAASTALSSTQSSISQSNTAQSGTDVDVSVTMTTPGDGGSSTPSVSVSVSEMSDVETSSATSTVSSGDHEVGPDDEVFSDQMVLFIVGGVAVFVILCTSCLCLLMVCKRNRRRQQVQMQQRRRGGAHGHSRRNERSLGGSSSGWASRKSRVSQYDTVPMSERPLSRSRQSRRALAAPPSASHYGSAPPLPSGGIYDGVPMTEMSNSTYDSLALQPPVSSPPTYVELRAVRGRDGGSQYGQLAMNDAYTKAPAQLYAPAHAQI